MFYSVMLRRLKNKLDAWEENNRTRLSAGICLTISVLLHGAGIYLCAPVFINIDQQKLIQPSLTAKSIPVVTVQIEDASASALHDAKKKSKNAVFAKNEEVPSIDKVSIKKHIDLPERYYSKEQLTRAPELVSGEPELVQLEQGSSFSGYIELDIAVTKSGKVNSIHVVQSSVPAAILEDVVLQFYEAGYRPGEIAGTPVNSNMRIAIQLDHL